MLLAVLAKRGVDANLSVGEGLLMSGDAPERLAESHITSPLLSSGGDAGCSSWSWLPQPVVISRESASILETGRLHFSPS